MAAQPMEVVCRVQLGIRKPLLVQASQACEIGGVIERLASPALMLPGRSIAWTKDIAGTAQWGTYDVVTCWYHDGNLDGGHMNASDGYCTKANKRGGMFDPPMQDELQTMQARIASLADAVRELANDFESLVRRCRQKRKEGERVQQIEDSPDRSKRPNGSSCSSPPTNPRVVRMLCMLPPSYWPLASDCLLASLRSSSSRSSASLCLDE